MLSDWFSVSLGAKLLEHLQKWTTPEGPVAPAGLRPGHPAYAWRPGEEAQVATSMLDLFHLLPRQVRGSPRSRHWRSTRVALVDRQRIAEHASGQRITRARGARAFPADVHRIRSLQAVQFLEANVEATRMGLVILTIELEERLDTLRLPIPSPRTSHSPYRPPLARFLNK